MKKTGLLVALAAVGLAVQACGGSDGTGTGGGGGAGTGGAGGKGGGSAVVCPTLTRDGQAHQYLVTSVVVGSDGCDLGIDQIANSTIPVTYTVDTTVTPIINDIKVGSIFGDPAEPSFGHGAVSGLTCKGDLAKDNKITYSATSECVYRDKVESTLTITAPDTFTLDVTVTDSEFTAKCTTEGEIKASILAAGTCTTTAKLTFTKAAAGGAGGGSAAAGGKGGGGS